jgi:hypothetical protein
MDEAVSDTLGYQFKTGPNPKFLHHPLNQGAHRIRAYVERVSDLGSRRSRRQSLQDILLSWAQRNRLTLSRPHHVIKFGLCSSDTIRLLDHCAGPLAGAIPELRVFMADVGLKGGRSRGWRG